MKPVTSYHLRKRDREAEKKVLNKKDKKILALMVGLILIFSGCLTSKYFNNETQTDETYYSLPSFEFIKQWNKDNAETTEIALDSCNMAYRIDAYKWEINLKDC